MTRLAALKQIGWLFALMLTVLLVAGPATAPTPAYGQASTDVLGNDAQTEFWRAIRQGEKGSVSIQDKKAGQLIQSEGDNWRTLRNGPLSVYGAQALIGIVMLLAIFFLFRGRVKIDHGWSGWTIKRFNGLERFGHWLMAGSFIILGLSGLNMLYGRYLLMPLIGPNGFATLAGWGKVAHNYVAFAFMLSLILVFVMWVVHNMPSRTDITWVLKGGGIIGKSHPPAKKFNFGQKIIFWSVILCGASISLSGIALLFPFQMTMFADTFAILNVFGFNLPTELTGVQEMQLAQLWHSIVSLVLICVIIGHIYIGTIGMEGAFDAMGTGRVDLNWAKEHHSLWVEKLDEKGQLDPQRDVAGRVIDGEPAE
ncbi:MAG: formate dehydrogenase subunit gamma [Rhizobiales bacterium]|nr:formate dehydrogenase subunit gamma [Hyphomicrobiales bacterium]